MVALVALAMLPTGALAIRSGLDAAAARSQAASDMQVQRAAAGAALARARLAQGADLLQAVASQGADLLGNQAVCNRRLTELSGGFLGIALLIAVDERLRVTCGGDGLPPLDLRNSRILARARTSGDLVGGISRRPEISAEPLFGVAVRVRSLSDPTAGYFALAMTLDTVFSELAKGAEGAVENVALADSSGQFAIARPMNEAADALVEAIRAHDFAGEPEIVQTRYDNLTIVATPVFGQDIWAFSAVAPPTPSLGSRLGDAAAVASPLALWLLAVAAAWLAMEMAVVRPLKSLERTAQVRSEGRIVVGFPDEPLPPTEIYRVRTAVDDMAARLTARSEELETALAEEKALLREVHHRVKNNLQTVASLLQIQARAANDVSESWGLARAYDRVQLLAMVHQRIYASGVVREIRLDDLAADIARHLVTARGEASAGVRLTLLLEPTRCDADKVAAMAFLIGEGLTRAIDAIADGPAVELRLHISSLDGVTRLAIDTFGPLDRETQPSVELRFIEAFAKQLRARIGVLTDHPALLWCEVMNLSKEVEDTEEA
jgi:two-component sensor histidine kinase